MNPDFLAAIEHQARPAVITLLLSVTGAAILDRLYKAIKTNWPEAYTTISTDFDKQVRTSPIRSLVLFRGVPVFLIALFTVVMAERYGGNSWICATLLAGFYLTPTTLKLIAEIVKPPRDSNWVVMLGYQCGSAVAVVTVVILATSLRASLEVFIPPTKDILIALWAGLFATLFTAAARNSLRPVKLTGAGIVNQLKDDIGAENWAYTAKAAQGNTELKYLLRAILLAEAQQRPRWFRRMERIKGLFYRPGTYGVAQVASAKPIGDKESIDILAQRFEGYDFYTDYHTENYGRLKADLYRIHNQDWDHAVRIVDFLRQRPY